MVNMFSVTDFSEDGNYVPPAEVYSKNPTKTARMVLLGVLMGIRQLLGVSRETVRSNTQYRRRGQGRRIPGFGSV